MGEESKNPLFGYDLVPLASYVVNFKSLGPKLWKFFTENDQISPVKYKSIDLLFVTLTVMPEWQINRPSSGQMLVPFIPSSNSDPCLPPTHEGLFELTAPPSLV